MDCSHFPWGLRVFFKGIEDLLCYSYAYCVILILCSNPHPHPLPNLPIYSQPLFEKMEKGEKGIILKTKLLLDVLVSYGMLKYT